MAIVVDKEEKRKSIALVCKDLIVNEDIKNLTISKITQKAAIGKGSFYEYFDNKEDLVFELVSIMMGEYNSLMDIKLNNIEGTLDKLKLFVSFFYDPKYSDLRRLYNQFTAISLTNPNSQMQQFQIECFELYSKWLEEIISDGIEKGEIKPEAKGFAKVLVSSVKGIYITCVSTGQNEHIQQEIDRFIEFFYSFVKVNK